MTTTLRPTGPIEQDADGVRTRAFDVCDNGRPVGAVGIATDASLGPTAGVLASLRIEEPHRRRGRGTIAALAAEEVLRGWGCTQVRVVVPAGNEAALQLAEALGYVERSRNMVKELGRSAPALPDGVTARPMTEEEYARWESTSAQEYAQDWIDRGVPRAQALRKAEYEHAAGLPDGLATAGMTFHVLLAGGEAVGHVWVAQRELSADETLGYVFDVSVGEAWRGRGYGRALMHRAEEITLGAGQHRLGLHVFAANDPALRLYESLGYAVTQYNLGKPL